ncbi:MAG: hypothetical protein RJB61_1880 [Actinomycetota bacterium]
MARSRNACVSSAGMSTESRRRTVEWPTVALLASFAAAWLALVLGHESVPWWAAAPAMVYMGGLWMSFGHELLHGHPTRWNWMNGAVGWLPLSMWLPFSRYKYWHVVHHFADLTDPIEDPESFYVTPSDWEGRTRLGRAWTLLLRTAPGRVLLGPWRAIPRFWLGEVRCLGERRIVSQWLVQVVLAVSFGWWTFGIVGYPWLEYVLCFVIGGSSCTHLRSFVEHQAVASGTRSAVVKAGPVMSLLFLNNNLHHTHHAQPDLAWYRLPAAHRRLGSDALAADGAGFYPGGYLQVVRTYFFRPFHQPVHPLPRP